MKGFTLIELIIVVAVMGIIGAVLVPAFGNIAAKSKISTDISTAQTIKRLIDAYHAEGNIPSIVKEDKKEQIGRKLYDAGYLESKSIYLQTGGELTYTPPTTSSPSKLQVNLGSKSDQNTVDENILDMAHKMVDSENVRYTDWLTIS